MTSDFEGGRTSRTWKTSALSPRHERFEGNAEEDQPKRRVRLTYVNVHPLISTIKRRSWSTGGSIFSTGLASRTQMDGIDDSTRGNTAFLIASARIVRGDFRRVPVREVQSTGGTASHCP